MSKSEYIRGLLLGRVVDARVVEAVLIYWHSQIPL